MKTILYPKKSTWFNLGQRPKIEAKKINLLVKKIFTEIKAKGDQALIKYSKKYDQIQLNSFKVRALQLKRSQNNLSAELFKALDLAKNNIEKFHLAQKEAIKKIEISTGITCWRESRPIEKIGLYIPGGTAPLFSTVLMLGIPAKIAGCKEIVLCTPPNQQGQIDPIILAAAQMIGLNQVFKIGGIQAIGAMTFGTETIPKVDKIFGPGNIYVTAAKQAAQFAGVAIDMPAGPSEVLVIADNTCNPDFVAADLLSQAEHGKNSQVILLTIDKSIAQKVTEALTNQLQNLPRKKWILNALENSKIILFKKIEECFQFSNEYAPEHLVLALKNYNKYLALISNAGSVFLGNYSCEAIGDYASGPNHTLPTNGFAKSYSGVSLDSFVKKISFQHQTRQGLKSIGPAVELLAKTEDLLAHKLAVSIRLKNC